MRKNNKKDRIIRFNVTTFKRNVIKPALKICKILILIYIFMQGVKIAGIILDSNLDYLDNMNTSYINEIKDHKAKEGIL